MIKTDPAECSQHSDKPKLNLPDHYAAMHQGFTWQVDEYFNIAEVCCSRWARADAHKPDATKSIAIRPYKTCGSSLFYTYFELEKAAAALSHVLASLSVQRGDRVAIVMPQRFETAVAYMAVFQMGAVAMPLSMLFGPEALAFRLQDSEAVVAICDDSSIVSIQAVRAECPALRSVIAVDVAVDAAHSCLDYATAVTQHQSAFQAVKTKAEEAAILIYTSGTTGPPKGALQIGRAHV